MKPIGVTQADPKHSGKHTSLVFAILVLRIQAMVFQLRNIEMARSGFGKRAGS